MFTKENAPVPETTKVLWRATANSRHVINSFYLSEIRYEKFVVVKETEKSYRIRRSAFSVSLITVPKVAKKAFARPTKQEALNDLKYRTLRRIKILKANLSIAESIETAANSELTKLQ